MDDWSTVKVGDRVRSDRDEVTATVKEKLADGSVMLAIDRISIPQRSYPDEAVDWQKVEV